MCNDSTIVSPPKRLNRWIGMSIIALTLVISAAVTKAHPGGHNATDKEIAHAAEKHEHEDHVVNLSAVLEALRSFRETGAADDLERARGPMRQALARAPRDTRVRYLAARVAQAEHDFAGALEHLAPVLVARPADGPANALAASILTLQGQGELALVHCDRARIDWLERSGCRLRAQQATGEPPVETDLRRFLRLLHALPETVAAEKRAWLLATAGDLAAQHDLWGLAHEQFQAALVLDNSTRHRAAVAEALLQLQRPSEVLRLIRADSEALGLRVKRARAAQALGMPTDTGLAGDIDALRRVGDVSHAREAGEYLLYVAEDLAGASAILRAGLAVQREADDVRLVREAQRRLQHRETVARELGLSGR